MLQVTHKLSKVQGSLMRENSLVVSREPDGGEVTPTEFAYYDIAPVAEGVADVYRVVSALDIVFPVFFVLCGQGVNWEIGACNE